jgi:twitching motility two-component system response regulator PilG
MPTPNGASPSEKAQVLLDNGIAAAQKGDRRSARLLLDLAVEAEPSLVDGWMWLASISEYPEELLSYLDKVLDIDPQNQKAIVWQLSTRSLMAKTLVQKAVEANENGDRDGAVSLLDQALEYDENCVVAWSWKATLEDDEDKKVELLNRVLQIDPENSEAGSAIDSIRAEKIRRKRRDAGQALVEGSISNALSLFSELSELDEYRAEAHMVAGFFGDTLESKLAAFRSAAAADPGDALSQLAVNFLQRLTDAEAERMEVSAAPAPLETAYDVEETQEIRIDEPAVEEGARPEAAYFAAEEMAAPEFSAEAEEPVVEAAPEFDPYSTIAPEPAPAETRGDEPVEFSTDDSGRHETQDHRAEQIFIPAASDEDTATQAISDSADTENCLYCSSELEPGAFSCGSCGSALTLADLEMLLSPHEIEHEIVSNAVVAMEAEWNLRDLSVRELVGLGIGHLNLGNFDEGLKYLEEASRHDPNDVILSGQINAIAIRLEELRRQEDAHSAMPRGKTILVIDDSATIRKLISAKLEKSGHDVVTAEDGVEGLEKLAEKTPDLVLLDITMPKMDGYEVCKQIRANPATKDIPVVMISGKDGFFDKVRGRMSGATGYVTKPFGPETLMKALDTYLIPDGTLAN